MYSLFPKIVTLNLFLFLLSFISRRVFASGIEVSIFDDVLSSVYNIILTIIIVLMCFGILTYLYIRNSNKGERSKK